MSAHVCDNCEDDTPDQPVCQSCAEGAGDCFLCGEPQPAQFKPALCEKCAYELILKPKPCTQCKHRNPDLYFDTLGGAPCDKCKHGARDQFEAES